MKRLHVAKHAAEAHLVRGYLESHGIASIVRGEFLTGGFGELPLDICAVWLKEEREFTRADELVREFLSGTAASRAGAPWFCAQCDEPLEGQFTACWNCGAPRPASS
jgi:hypothetical protein